MDEFLLENGELSPSKLLQSKINEVYKNRKSFFPALRRKDEKIEHVTRLHQEKVDEIFGLRKRITKLEMKLQDVV